MGTFIRIELIRTIRNPYSLAFTIGLPAFLFVIFGVNQDWSTQSIGRGNVAMLTMINMATYGAVIGTTSIAGTAAVERLQGWGRQLGLTPMTDAQFIFGKTIASSFIALLPIGLIYTIGAFTTADAPGWVWASAGAITACGALLFSLYGLCVGTTFGSDNAVGISSGLLVIFGFLGNIFVPLSGVLLTIAKFTPLYGLAALARRPLTQGYSYNPEANSLALEPMWQILANVVVWMMIFALVSLWMMRRTRERA